MELLLFGHAGQPVVVFPTSMGSFYEYEDRGMIAALGDRIEAGRLLFLCVDSVDSESWYNRGAHPRYRVERYLAYERYILDEVLPLARSRGSGGDGRAVVTGCSLGAFHAAELAFRHPRTVNALIALSGKYDNSNFLDGYSDDEAYFTNPLAFLRGLESAEYLEPLRQMHILIATGSTDPHVQEAHDLSRVLWERGVPNTLDVWDGWVHDWPYWQQMIRKFL